MQLEIEMEIAVGIAISVAGSGFITNPVSVYFGQTPVEDPNPVWYSKFCSSLQSYRSFIDSCRSQSPR